jgi:hypothetical protein
MSITIDATVGGASANSHVTEAEAIAIAAITPNLVGWVTVSGSTCTEDEKRALVAATDWLTTLIYQGARVTTTQSLAWPRYNAQDPDASRAGGAYGYYAGYSSVIPFLPTVMPTRIKRGTCALAFAITRAGTTDILTLDSKIGVVEKTIGPITTKWAEPSQRAQGLARFPEVMRWLGPLLSVGAGQVRLTR